MIVRAPIAVVIAASALSACGSGPRVSSIPVPGAPVSPATDMVRQQQAQRDADVRCSWEESEVLAGRSGKKNQNKTNPSCGSYGR